MIKANSTGMKYFSDGTLAWAQEGALVGFTALLGATKPNKYLGVTA